MRYLLLKICLNKEQGFTLIELIIVVVIVGISAAVGISNLVGSQRQARANEALNQLRSALQSAQANANRLSQSCTVTITENTDNYTITALTTPPPTPPTTCIQENITIDSDIVDIDSSASSGPPWTIDFTFTGTTNIQQTFFIGRRIGTTVDTSNANCLVISDGLGLIRTGKTNGNATISAANCINIENIKYDNEN